MDYKTLDIVFQYISAIGSIASVCAFLYFLRDRDKQAQTYLLASISIFLRTQNSIMKQTKKLSDQQVDTYKKILDIKENDIETFNAQKKSVKPDLWLDGAGYKGYEGELHIDINNKGEDAKLLELRCSSEDIVLFCLNLPYNLEKGQRRYIFGKQNGVKHIQYCEYEIDVIYTDKLGTKYLTKIKGKGGIARIVETTEIDR